MADVTNPAGAKFVREQVRPLCEEARAFGARVAAMQTAWFAGMNTVIGSGAGDHVIESRSAEGVPDLTSAQVTNAVSNLLAMLGAGNAEIISIPCVRPLEAH